MNKSLLNIAGIIAFIFGILACCTIVGCIVGIPLIIGGNKFREYALMSDEDITSNKDNILIWSIVFLFLCQVSGVLGLIFYVLSEYKSNTNNTNEEVKNNHDKYDELEKLNKLYKDKVLTKEEFEKEKKRILE